MLSGSDVHEERTVYGTVVSSGSLEEKAVDNMETTLLDDMETGKPFDVRNWMPSDIDDLTHCLPGLRRSCRRRSSK